MLASWASGTVPAPPLALGLPLLRAGGALGQLPLEAKEVLEVAVAPLRRGGRPRAFEAAGDRVGAASLAVRILPARSLLLDASGGRLPPDVLAGVGGAVRLAEGVAAGDQRDGLFVVHRHAPERLADVAGSGERVGVAVGAFRIDIDQAHLHRAERVIEFAVAGVALVAEPLGLRSPVDVLRRLPDVRATAGEPEGLEARRLQRAVSGEDHEVGPGDFLAVLLLERPEQKPGLVEVGVVGPAVERREPERPEARAAASVVDAVGARAVPGHADEERAVGAEVGGPPVLRRRHEREDLFLQRLQIDFLEFFGVVERRVGRVGERRVLAQNIQLELVRPPVAVLHPASGDGLSRFGGAVERALARPAPRRRGALAVFGEQVLRNAGERGRRAGGQRAGDRGEKRPAAARQNGIRGGLIIHALIVFAKPGPDQRGFTERNLRIFRRIGL